MLTHLDIAPFQELIKLRCGLVLEGNNEEKLAGVLRQRFAALGCANAGDYLTRLYGDHGEFQELVNLLTINETYFFRESEQLALLTDVLVPRLLSRRGNKLPLRILSAGCSSGEEPYSILMALHEKYGESSHALFAVSGGDIDTQVLAKARAGCYGEFSFRGVAEPIRQRYFERDPYAWRIREELRKRVTFHRLNLLDSIHPGVSGGFDVIFFRNVSIYFDTETRRRIQRNLSALMKEDGHLVIGTAETLANNLGEMALVEEAGLFYFMRHGAPSTLGFPANSELPPPVAALPEPVALPPLTAPTPFVPLEKPAENPFAFAAGFVSEPSAPLMTAPARPSLDEIRCQVDEKRYDEALGALDRLLAGHPDDGAALLLKAHVQLNRKAFAEAQQCAQRVLDGDPWSVDALMVLGLAAKWREQQGDAVRWFKQAVYARHECWPARYYLAELYRNAGETEKARREYRGVQQSLASRREDTGLKVVPLSLPAAEIRFLCEHQLAKLDGAKASLGK